MDSDNKVSVLLVCMGNICRSPTAEGVLRHLAAAAGLADRVVIESAGTHAYHVHEPPDHRAQAAAERRGISLGGIRARRVRDEDFARFDYILAMDKDNLALLMDWADPQYHDKIGLFLDYGSGRESEVPDPYYGGIAGFERVLDLVEEASRRFLETLQSTRLNQSVSR